MAYINTKTNQYPVSEQDIRLANPNTSFPIPFQAPEDYEPVLESPIPEFDRIAQSYKEVAPTKDSIGNWMRTYEVFDLDAEQVSANEEQAKVQVKNTAKSLLDATDWVEVPSVSNTENTPHLVNFNEYMEYRIALRAIAVNPVISPEWPVLPEETWNV